MNENLDVLCIPFKMRKELTFSLCGKFYLLFPASHLCPQKLSIIQYCLQYCQYHVKRLFTGFGHYYETHKTVNSSNIYGMLLCCANKARDNNNNNNNDRLFNLFAA